MSPDRKHIDAIEKRARELVTARGPEGPRWNGCYTNEKGDTVHTRETPSTLLAERDRLMAVAADMRRLEGIRPWPARLD